MYSEAAQATGPGCRPLVAPPLSVVMLHDPGVCTVAASQPVKAIDYGLDYKKELARRRRKIPEEEFTAGPEGLK